MSDAESPRRTGRGQRERHDPYNAARDLLRHNGWLASLPAEACARLIPQLERVDLERKTVVTRAFEPSQYAYLPVTAVISLISRSESGETLEVGMIGRDGILASSVLPGAATMPCDGIVQIPGIAYRMPAKTLRREVTADGSLHTALGRFAQVLLARSMQIAACNAFHAVEQRCVRWLLMVSDLADSREIPMTHELLAAVLGVRRPTMTLVLGALHRARLVEEERGRIIIHDRTRLETDACECYRAMRDAQRRLLGY
jgi:CRP-like cAMP-binding protein